MCAASNWYDRHDDPELRPRMLRVRSLITVDGVKPIPLSPEVALVSAKLAPGERLVEPHRRGRKFKLLAKAHRPSASELEAARPPEEDLWRGSKGGVIEIEDHGAVEYVSIDPVKGPQVYKGDGSIGFLDCMRYDQTWSDLSSADQKLHVWKAMRRNRAMVELHGEAHFRPELRRTPEESLAERCKAEAEKRVPPWRWMSIDEISLKNTNKRARGIIYGLEFPWTAELLAEFGPDWLTRAMHAAGTLGPKNKVTSIHIEETIKVTGGNNAGKFLFDVTYARREADLHTNLFAKVPFAMTKETKTDRISSSVYKQPSDLLEINTYRLLEQALPVKTPKYYFGDISNETSNFILITARIPFAGLGANGARPPRPLEVEGPYDKCKDWQLRGSPQEYYGLLMQASAKIAGAHKAGGMGSEDFLIQNHFNLIAFKTGAEAWGVNPQAVSGENIVDCRRKLDTAYKFISQIARPLFPEYATTGEFRDKFINTLMKWNAYRQEIEFWKNCDPNYVAMGHMNMNADNAYFWRDGAGKLECGVIDWGGFGVNCIGHKLWWCINCADFDHVRDHVSDYMDIFIATYREYGGPAVDKAVLSMMVFLTALGNVNFMVSAVPNCYTMCSQEEFASVTDRNDPRVAENIFGKSTLRTTLHVLDHGIRIIEELGADRVLDDFVRDVFQGSWGVQPKSDEVVFGE